MDTIGALTLLSMGDFFVEMKKTSEKATKGLYRTLSLSGKAIENLTKGDMMWPGGEVKLSSDQALDNVDVAEACGGHANLKPRFTDAPWKMAWRFSPKRSLRLLLQNTWKSQSRVLQEWTSCVKWRARSKRKC